MRARLDRAWGWVLKGAAQWILRRAKAAWRRELTRRWAAEAKHNRWHLN